MTGERTYTTLLQAIRKMYLFVALASFSIITSFSVLAQADNTLFFMHTIPQSNLINPAVQIPCKVFVGMPMLSSIHFNYSNSYFSYNDILTKIGDSLHVNFNYLNKNPNSIQDIAVELHVSIVNFGFLYKDYYFNFNVSDKVNVGLSYPTNLFDFAIKGNTPYVGQTINLGGLGVQGTYYREWAFGASKIISDRLTVGAKAKLLFGKANVGTSSSDIGLQTDLQTFYLTLTSNLVAMGSPFVRQTDVFGKFQSLKLPAGSSAASLLLNSQNKGMAFDLGAIYKLSERITLSGSVLDLGFIHWKFSPTTVSATTYFPQYRGFEFDPAHPSLTNLKQWLDSVKNSYTINTNNTPYYTYLSPTVYVGGTYALTENANAGLMTRDTWFNGVFQGSATASLNAWYKKFLSGSISWTYINGSFANFGAGASLRTPNFGLYATSDNVYGAFKWKSARLLNLRFGMNFLFGCKNCARPDKTLLNTGCVIFRDSEVKKQRFSFWKQKLEELKKKRKKGK
jgi:hypothetical protein